MTPDELVKDFHDGVDGVRNVDLCATVWAILEDVLQSVELAWQHQAEKGTDDLPEIVRGYVANHYGDL